MQKVSDNSCLRSPSVADQQHRFLDLGIYVVPYHFTMKYQLNPSGAQRPKKTCLLLRNSVTSINLLKFTAHCNNISY